MSVLAIAAGALAVYAGAALWGLYMALTQGLFSKLVAVTVPAQLHGTGFGIGPEATFLSGAGFAIVAAIGIVTVRRGASQSRPQTG